MCIIMMLGKTCFNVLILLFSPPFFLIIFFYKTGSFIFNQAWNLINSQSSIFHPWLPRAAKLVGNNYNTGIYFYY
jgi:hypothetical protein